MSGAARTIAAAGPTAPTEDRPVRFTPGQRYVMANVQRVKVWGGDSEPRRALLNGEPVTRAVFALVAKGLLVVADGGVRMTPRGRAAWAKAEG